MVNWLRIAHPIGKRGRGWTGCTAIAAAIGAVSPAVAQEQTQESSSNVLHDEHADKGTNEASVNDIVVTARRRNETAQSVPFAVSAFSGEQLSSLGVTSGRDIAKIVPGLAWRGSGPFSRNSVFIRGVGNNNFAFSTSPAVAVYIDDVYLNAQAFQGVASFDIERVEALKGPQGTLYGRNTTGGAVKFITRRPKVGAGLTADIDGEIGNFDYVKVDAGLGADLGSGAAMRLSLYSEDRGGLYRDYIVGDRLSAKNVKAARLQLLVEPTDRLSILVSGLYARARGDKVRYKRIDYVDPTSISFGPFGPTYSRTCASPTVGTGVGCTNLAVAFVTGPH